MNIGSNLCQFIRVSGNGAGLQVAYFEVKNESLATPIVA